MSSLDNAIQISTSDYLIKKKELENNIEWYEKTISTIDEQQDKRRSALFCLKYDLNKLKENYNGT